jgi:nitroreductase
VYDLERTIVHRSSTRAFLRDEPVPLDLVREALDLAVRAPSNSNVQPWQVVFASGPARDRLVKALLERAGHGAPQIPPLPDEFSPLREQLGEMLYGAMGISRHDEKSRRAAALRNWEFFRAPLAGVLSMHRDLDYVDAMGVGMFLQTLLLGLTARGLGTCVQVSIAGYPDALREQLGIAEEQRILCGLAVGYPDPGMAVNSVLVPRNPVEQHVRFVDA